MKIKFTEWERKYDELDAEIKRASAQLWDADEPQYRSIGRHITSLQNRMDELNKLDIEYGK